MKLGKKDTLIFLLITILLISIIYVRNEKTYNNFFTKKTFSNYFHLNKDDIFLYKLSFLSYFGMMPKDGWKFNTGNLSENTKDFAIKEQKQRYYDILLDYNKNIKDLSKRIESSLFPDRYNKENITLIINNVKITKINEVVLNLSTITSSISIFSKKEYIDNATYLFKYYEGKGWMIVQNISNDLVLKNKYIPVLPK
jgi:hypothetical protein